MTAPGSWPDRESALAELREVDQRLFEVDRRLADLSAERGSLLARRDRVLWTLHALDSRVPVVAEPAFLASPAAAAVPAPPVPVRETSGRAVQNVLLALGGLLLAVAAVTFTVLAWGRFGIAGRALILGAVTVATFAVPPVLVRRDLRATAETFAVLGIVLVLLDGYAAWHVGLFPEIDGGVYAGVVAAVAAAVAAGYSRLVPVRLTRPLAVVLVQPVPLLLARGIDLGVTEGSIVAAVTVAADLLLVARLPARARPEALPALLGAGVAWLLGTFHALTGLATLAAARHGAVLVLLALLAVVAGTMWDRAGRGTVVRHVAAAWTVVAAASALVAGVPGPPEVVLATAALLGAAAAALLPPTWRPGTVAGALLVVLAASVVPAVHVAAAAGAPLTWLDAPWTGAAGGSARALLSPGGWVPFAEPLAPLLLVTGAVAVLVSRRRGALRWVGIGALAPVTLLGVLAADLPWTAALAVEAVVAACAVGAVAVRRWTGPRSVALYAVGLGLAVHATVWATAARTATLVALALLALGTAAAAVVTTRRERDVLAVPAVVLALLALTAGAAAGGLAGSGRGTLWLPALVAVAAAPAVLTAVRLRRRWPVSSAAAAWTVPVTALAAATLAEALDPALTTALAGLVVATAAVAARQRVLGAVAALVTAVAAAVSLGEAGVALAGGTVGGLVPVTAGVVAVAAGVLGVCFGGRAWAVPAALPVAAAALVTVPAAYGFGWWYALGWYTALAVAGAVAAARTKVRTAPGRVVAATAASVSAIVGATALTWSLDRPAAALAVLTAALVTGGALAVAARSTLGRRVATAVAVLALQGVAGAAAAVLDLPPRWGALAVLAAAAAAAAGAAVVRAAAPLRSTIAEVGAAAGAVVAVGMTAGFLWHTGLVVALTGAVLGAVALRPDRRPAAVAAVLAKLAASWCWLAAAHVSLPEAYTLPAALVALAAGLVYLRRHPEASSWPVLGPALVAVLLPSLLGEEDAARRLFVGVAALVVVLAGAATRRQAPFVVGGTVLGLVAVRELGPVVADVLAAAPSWVPLLLGGVLLVATGATYEQRRRDLARVRRAVAGMN